MSTVAVVVGNPKPQSRTLAAATYVAQRAGRANRTWSSTSPTWGRRCSTGPTPTSPSS